MNKPLSEDPYQLEGLPCKDPYQYEWKIGLNEVPALPVTAGTNKGGHYFWYFSTFLLLFSFLTSVANTT